jgi:hypothetical protein
MSRHGKGGTMQFLLNRRQPAFGNCVHVETTERALCRVSGKISCELHRRRLLRVISLTGTLYRP